MAPLLMVDLAHHLCKDPRTVILLHLLLLLVLDRW